MLKAIGSSIRTFMIVFSFVVNLVLVIVLVVVLLLLPDINRNIAQPLVGGLHSSFVGLDEATIDWTIPVRDTIPVVLNIPLETNTVVTLTEAVPLQVAATINLPGVGTLNNAQVNLQLPAGLQLPVQLDLDVPVDETLDIALDVRAVIPLQETQLHDPIQNLRLLFAPLVRVLSNLPDNGEEVGPFVADVIDGEPPNLLAGNAEDNAWPGFSRTAGVDYELANIPAPPENLPLQTGLVPVGGIPALDETLRPEVYAQGGPQAVNEQAQQRLAEQGVANLFYDGTYAEAIELHAPPVVVTPDPIMVGQPPVENAPTGDLGILAEGTQG